MSLLGFRSMAVNSFFIMFLVFFIIIIFFFFSFFFFILFKKKTKDILKKPTFADLSLNGIYQRTTGLYRSPEC